MTDLDFMLRFMLQVLIVLVMCRIVGWFGEKYLGQAQVTMEMLTGVILGPSVFGLISPELQQKIFPVFNTAGDPSSGKSPSMTVLYIVAQIGLVLYMFVIGMEIDFNLLRTKSKSAALVSGAGILFPLILGVLTYFIFLRERTDLFGEHIPIAVQALYVGAAMCITAFPMLARIIYEAGIAGTTMGTLAISSGAFDDVVAWAMLAIVLAAGSGNALIAIYAIGGGAVFAWALFKSKGVIGSFLLKQKDQSMAFRWVILLLFGASWFTDAIGVYAVFGAFLLGIVIPKGENGHFAMMVKSKVEGITVALFLPFFFVYSGLNTRISSLNTTEYWLIAVVLLSAAIAGKLGGCYLASRLSGEPHRRALAIGVLMNSRGLMELIILNIGLQQKVIKTPFFTMMVLMAIVTTMMAAPLFRKLQKDGLLNE
jgi:Kef-type K+ transport system membrane component KefB